MITEIRRQVGDEFIVGQPELEPAWKAMELVLKDRPPLSIFPVDAIFLRARSYDDAGKWNVFALAAKLIRRGFAKYIVLLDSDGQAFGKTQPGEAYPGKDFYIQQLLELKVERSQIFLTAPSPDGTGFNTKTEGNAFLRLAQENGWTTAIDLNQPHGVTRAMLGLVKSMTQLDYAMAVWPMFPTNLNWEQQVQGSQGSSPELRKFQIPGELTRITRYVSDLATAEEYMAYQTRRGGLLILEKAKRLVNTTWDHNLILYLLTARIAAGHENDEIELKAQQGDEIWSQEVGQAWMQAGHYIDALAHSDIEQAYQLAMFLSLLPISFNLARESVNKWFRSDGPLLLAKDPLKPKLLEFLQNQESSVKFMQTMIEYIDYDFGKVADAETAFADSECFLAVAVMYLAISLQDEQNNMNAQRLFHLAKAKLSQSVISRVVRYYLEIPETAYISKALEPFLTSQQSGSNFASQP